MLQPPRHHDRRRWAIRGLAFVALASALVGEGDRPFSRKARTTFRSHWVTVSVIEAAWLLVPPEVVTETMLVPGGVPGSWCAGVPPPPQLDSAAIAPSTMIPNAMVAPPARRFFLPSAIHSSPVIPPKSEAYTGRLFFFPDGASRDTEGAVVVMVSVLVTGPPLGVSDEGANEHCDSAGNPEQEKVTSWLKPFVGVTVKVKDALAPALMVALAGDTVME
jgi:hypothetical protein